MWGTVRNLHSLCQNSEVMTAVVFNKQSHPKGTEPSVSDDHDVRARCIYGGETTLSFHLSLSVRDYFWAWIDCDDAKDHKVYCHSHAHGKHKNDDKTRVNSEEKLTHTVSFSLSSLFPLSSLYTLLSLLLKSNQWQTSVYCLFCARSSALLLHPPLQRCFFPSVPLLITSRVTLNFPCPGRWDTSLNSHNYSSSPLTI